MKEEGKQKRVQKRSISAPSDLLEDVDKVMLHRRIASFSEYIRMLIRRDLEECKNSRILDAA